MKSIIKFWQSFINDKISHKEYCTLWFNCQQITNQTRERERERERKRERERNRETDRQIQKQRQRQKDGKQRKYTKWWETMKENGQKSEIFAWHHLNCQIDLLTRPKSNLNMLIENPYIYTTSYLMKIKLALSITMFDIFTVEMCMTLTSTNRRWWATDRSQIRAHDFLFQHMRKNTDPLWCLF